MYPCWLVPCGPHKIDLALKSPHIMLVSPSTSSISSRKSELVPMILVEESMSAWMRIRDLCLSGFSIQVLCNSHEQVDHCIQVTGGYCLAKIAPNYYCLTMAGLEALVVNLGIYCFLKACHIKVFDHLFQDNASSVGTCTVQ